MSKIRVQPGRLFLPCGMYAFVALVLLFVSTTNAHVDSEDEDWLEDVIRHVYGGEQQQEQHHEGHRARRRDEHRRSTKSSSRKHQETTTHHEPQRPVTAVIPGFGKVRGRREGGIDFWGGIPYAAPPVGTLRWAPPEPPQPWEPAKLDASHFGPDCWQLTDPLTNPVANAMSEDCLYLNIFTPAGHAKSRQGVLFSHKLLPVMVWFHGGAFQQGGARRAEYDGRRLAERDILVVTINYRLGALGFLVSSSDGLYGNFGLMDQRAAMEWVRRNIRAFGGDPDNVTLFGESAGAVMIGLHLMMEGAGTRLFHRAILQSNPLGYTFRSVVVADWIGEALKRNVDCRDLACLRAERVEEIMRAQSSLMGVPRSVGDFFTWGPTLTQEVRLSIGNSGDGRSFVSRSDEHRLFRKNLDKSFYEWRQQSNVGTSDSWSAVNVSQPLKGLDMIPDDIPIMIGSNKHEGEMFVHSAFPTSMPKPVYWMFVGALFRDSASRVLRHYRGYVDQIEKEGEELARQQLEEEEAKLYYLEHREQLDSEYQLLLAMNATRQSKVVTSDGLETLVKTWSTGGGFSMHDRNETLLPPWRWRNPFSKQHEEDTSSERETLTQAERDETQLPPWWWRNPFLGEETALGEKLTRVERAAAKAKLRLERRAARQRARALKEAAKVVVDYRPVMSRIIDDYLFRCPTWHYAHLLSQGREQRSGTHGNVYVYRFSQPTHIPGYKECWGKSCHTAELPYVFQAMDVIRSNYSTLGPIAQNEAPSAPEYPYTEILEAYRGALEATTTSTAEQDAATAKKEEGPQTSGNHTKHTKAFQSILTHFFGDYFVEDADEELASDMAERWVAFAKEGNPNYDGSKAEWMPWRRRPSDDHDEVEKEERSDKDENPWDAEYDYWSGDDDDDDFESSDHDEFDDEDDAFIDLDKQVDSTQAARERAYRRRALAAMDLEGVEEDVFRTELRNTHHGGDNDSEKTFLSRKLLNRWHKDDVTGIPPMSKGAIREAIRVAQEMGVLGTGLKGEERWPGGDWDGDFFPEFLELRWPPEGRLIERDCTCDMWDKIRYRY